MCGKTAQLWAVLCKIRTVLFDAFASQAAADYWAFSGGVAEETREAAAGGTTGGGAVKGTGAAFAIYDL